MITGPKQTTKRALHWTTQFKAKVFLNTNQQIEVSRYREWRCHGLGTPAKKVTVNGREPRHSSSLQDALTNREVRRRPIIARSQLG